MFPSCSQQLPREDEEEEGGDLVEEVDLEEEEDLAEEEGSVGEEDLEDNTRHTLPDSYCVHPLLSACAVPVPNTCVCSVPLLSLQLLTV